MTPFIALFTLISTILILLIFVIINSSLKIRREMQKEYNHIMNNLKGISKLILENLDDKHNEIEATGEKYIKLMKENGTNTNCPVHDEQQRKCGL